MRERIAEIILSLRGDRYDCADKILALFPSLDNIVVVEKCGTPYYRLACPLNCHDCENLVGEINAWECATDGTITRKAEWGDIDAKIIRWIKAFMIISEGNIELLEGEDLLLHLQNLADDAVTTKSGRLGVKE